MGDNSEPGGWHRGHDVIEFYNSIKPNMTKTTRKILLISGAAAIIIIALITFIKAYVTPERLKAFLVPYAEQTLNRKISVGEMEISLLKGIDIKDVAIKEADEKTDFVKCKDVVLKFRLLPLLSRKVVIDELKLLSPSVRIMRDDKGAFNFEGIGRKEKAEAAKEEKQAAETKGLPVSLLVNNVSIKDSRFSFVDSTKKLPGVKGSFDIDTSIKSADGSELFSKGDIALKLEELVLQEPSNKRIKNIVAALNYAIRLNLVSNEIRVDKADFKIQDMPASITGDIRNFRKEPELDIALSLPKTKLSDLQKELSAVVDLKGLALSGLFSTDVKVKGIPKKADTLKADGLVSLEKTGIAYNNFNTVLDGNIKFSEQIINIDVKGVIGKNTAAGKGRFNLNGFVDLSRPGYGYSLSSSIDSVHADELVNSFSPKAKDTVFGIISADLKLNGAGTLPESIKKNLVADGDFNIRDGKITGTQLTRNLSQFLNIKELETVDLRQANGTVKIGNGIARLDSVFSSDDLAMNPSGNIGLDETLELAFDLKLSPRLSKKTVGSSISKYIKDEEGWGLIPLKVTGTFSHPSYNVDIAKAGKRIIEKEVGKALDKLFKKGKGTGTEGDKTQQDKKSVEDLLKGIFK